VGRIASGQCVHHYLLRHCRQQVNHSRKAAKAILTVRWPNGGKYANGLLSMAGTPAKSSQALPAPTAFTLEMDYIF
jgi:hypothetical protein